MNTCVAITAFIGYLNCLDGIHRHATWKSTLISFKSWRDMIFRVRTFLPLRRKKNAYRPRPQAPPMKQERPPVRPLVPQGQAITMT